MTTMKKIAIFSGTIVLSAYLGLSNSVADEVTTTDRQSKTAEVWPGSAALWWGFPPVDGVGRIPKIPKTAEQQFAAFRTGSWPGAQESRWGDPHVSESSSVNAPSVAEQWAAVKSGNWPGKAESRWGQAHVSSDDAKLDRQVAVDSE